MDSTAHYFSVVMFYELQSSAYFLIVMLIPNLFFLSPAPTIHCFSGRRNVFENSHILYIQTGILRTDAVAKFFITKILIVYFKSIKQKTVEAQIGILKSLFANFLYLEFCNCDLHIPYMFL